MQHPWKSTERKITPADKVEKWKLILGTPMTSCALLRAKKLSKFPDVIETAHDL